MRLDHLLSRERTASSERERNHDGPVAARRRRARPTVHPSRVRSPGRSPAHLESRIATERRGRDPPHDLCILIFFFTILYREQDGSSNLRFSLYMILFPTYFGLFLKASRLHLITRASGRRPPGAGGMRHPGAPSPCWGGALDAASRPGEGGKMLWAHGGCLGTWSR